MTDSRSIEDSLRGAGLVFGFRFSVFNSIGFVFSVLRTNRPCAESQVVETTGRRRPLWFWRAA